MYRIEKNFYPRMIIITYTKHERIIMYCDSSVSKIHFRRDYIRHRPPHPHFYSEMLNTKNSKTNFLSKWNQLKQSSFIYLCTVVGGMKSKYVVCWVDMSQLIFIFPLFWGMVMCANEVKTKEKPQCCYAIMPMFTDAHISSLGYLWKNKN